VWQFFFQSPTKHPTQFFEDVILIVLCHLIFRIVLLEDSYPDICQSLLVSSWSTRVSGPLRKSDAFHRGTSLGPSQGFPCLGMPVFPSCWVPLVPGWPTLALFSFHLAHPDSFVLTRWRLDVSHLLPLQVC
jgi:hypothetical protein